MVGRQLHGATTRNYHHRVSMAKCKQLSPRRVNPPTPTLSAGLPRILSWQKRWQKL